jgi:hypothetical protein
LMLDQPLAFAAALRALIEEWSKGDRRPRVACEGGRGTEQAGCQAKSQ